MREVNTDFDAFGIKQYITNFAFKHIEHCFLEDGKMLAQVH